MPIWTPSYFGERRRVFVNPQDGDRETGFSGEDKDEAATDCPDVTNEMLAVTRTALAQGEPWLMLSCSRGQRAGRWWGWPLLMVLFIPDGAAAELRRRFSRPLLPSTRPANRISRFNSSAKAGPDRANSTGTPPRGSQATRFSGANDGCVPAGGALHGREARRLVVAVEQVHDHLAPGRPSGRCR